MEEKFIAESELKNQYGQVVFDDEPPIGKHFQKFRSKNKFKLLPYAVYIKPDEVYQPFVEIDQNLNYHERTLFDHRVTIVKTLLLFIMI